MVAVVDEHGVIITMLIRDNGKRSYSMPCDYQLSPGEQESWRNIEIPRGMVKTPAPKFIASFS